MRVAQVLSSARVMLGLCATTVALAWLLHIAGLNVLTVSFAGLTALAATMWAISDWRFARYAMLLSMFATVILALAAILVGVNQQLAGVAFLHFTASLLLDAKIGGGPHTKLRPNGSSLPTRTS